MDCQDHERPAHTPVSLKQIQPIQPIQHLLKRGIADSDSLDLQLCHLGMESKESTDSECECECEFISEEVDFEQLDEHELECAFDTQFELSEEEDTDTIQPIVFGFPSYLNN
eukprot:CAMPEP_0116940224 /NCGR_PEP_ID=MMETSP0467-20121206/33237_1 /TAXON_ID=283647 /ORGANISM="Mesodinium pulex, Strain SPMC105" /LENGTH=111 /DNA_ID=CAMNT_0004622719 /DNA_START=132 /DNA_END=467 /DNA_ORIENTATION=+